MGAFALSWKPTAAAAATGILVGSAMVATRLVIHQGGPASLALWRYGIGVCCLLPVVLLGPRVRFAPRDVLPIALLGVTQFGVLIALLNVGLAYIPAARAALIFALLPLLTMLLAAAAGRERLTAWKVGGVLLTVAAIGLALGEKALHRGNESQAWIGELAVLASAASGAACSVLYRPYLRRYPALAVSALAMLASVVFLAGIAATEGFWSAPPRFTAEGWLAVGFIGVNSGIGYYLWLWALGRAPATQVTVFLSLSPVTAALLGALLLDEALSSGAVLGLLGVVLGLVLAHRPETPRAGAVGGDSAVESRSGGGSHGSATEPARSGDR